MSELVERFHRIARDTPDRLLLHARSEARALSAAAIRDEAGQAADALAAEGLGADCLLVSVAGNRSGFYPLLLACLTRGVALMPVDRGTTLPEVLELASRFGAIGLVLAGGADAFAPGDAEGAPCASPHPGRRHRRRSLPGGLVLVILEDAEPTPEVYRGAAVLKLTSGSTGLPRAAFTTTTHLLLDSQHIVEAMGIRPGDTQLGLIPLSHAYGIGSLVVPLFIQGTAVVLRESFVPGHVPDDAAAYGARVFPGVPFMFEHLAAHLPADAWPRSLETLISAGARLDVEMAQGFASRFGVKIHSFYGTTETGGICYDASDAIVDAPTVGWPLPGVVVTLRDDHSATPASATPGCGRVHVAGDAVTAGYAGLAGAESEGGLDRGTPNPESGSAGEGGFVDGGFLTGDLGRLEEDGRLVLAGRVSAFINVAGRKVQPDEVERVLQEMPAIVEARVLGMPDERRGQQLVACVVAREPGLRPFAIRQFCASRLSPYKIPRAFVFVEELPRDIRGKTNRRALEALVAERLR
jgi:long-chain acyl-CoA synthetase